MWQHFMTKWSSWQHPSWVKWISIFNNAPPLDDWKAKLESNTPARKTEAKPHSHQTTILGLHYLEECKTPSKRNNNKLIQKKKKDQCENITLFQLRCHQCIKKLIFVLHIYVLKNLDVNLIFVLNKNVCQRPLKGFF